MNSLKHFQVAFWQKDIVKCGDHVNILNLQALVDSVVSQNWQVSFTGHIPQVKVQVTVLQINIQAQKCLLALITVQNVVLD